MNLIQLGKKLENKAYNLEIPSGYITQDIPRFIGFKIAVDYDNNHSLLIDESLFTEKLWSKSNYTLENLEIKFNVKCQITDLNSSQSKKGKFTIIKLINNNNSMREYFYRIMEGVIIKISNSPSITSLNKEIEYLIELFAKKANISQSVLVGLWGELYFIKQSKNIEESIKAWHNDTNKLFDFSFSDFFVEVKTTTKPSRIHTFNNKQLIDYELMSVEIVSILTEKNYQGISINNLWDDISNKINNVDLKTKLSQIISKTIGNNNIEQLNESKFNENLAKSTLKIYNSKAIPRVKEENIPKGILNLKLDVDLNE